MSDWWFLPRTEDERAATMLFGTRATDEVGVQAVMVAAIFRFDFGKERRDTEFYILFHWIRGYSIVYNTNEMEFFVNPNTPVQCNHTS